MLVDVVIPNYNRTHLLERAVRSVLYQEKVGQILVLDDGSNLETRNFYHTLKSLSPRIQIYEYPHTGDPGYLRDQGVLKASAEWIGFLDSDDFWKQDRVRSNLNLLGDNNLNLVCSNAEVEFREGFEGNHLYHKSRKSGFFTLAQLLNENIVITSSVLVRKSSLCKVGGFASLPANPCEDFATWLRLATRGGLYYNSVPEVVYSYAVNSYGRNFAGELEKIAIDNFSKWVWKSGLRADKRCKILIQISIYKSRRFVQKVRTQLRERTVFN